MSAGFGTDDLDALQAGGVVLPPPSAPMAVAREFVNQRYTWPRLRSADTEGTLVLRHWRGGWWRWEESRWVEIHPRAIEAKLYEFTENAVYGKSDGQSQDWNPNRKKIGDVLAALTAVCLLPDEIADPGWVDRREQRSPIVACDNGLLEVNSRTLRMHTPWYFNQTAVPFAYDPDAPAPERWRVFLSALWPDDGDSIAALQEWFGYVVSGRTDLHKILLLVGPTRGRQGRDRAHALRAGRHTECRRADAVEPRR
jgi:putative DNA primase/helicase